jgi:hypothetical protein
MTDVTRALAQIEAIHDQLARSGVYRGWRSVPVAASGVIGLVAAAWQATTHIPVERTSFTAYWSIVAMVAIAVGCCEIAWHYVRHATETERRRSRLVLGQFLPALVAAALVTAAFVRVSPELVSLLPGVWALCFGVAIFAARPYLPAASAFVAAYYWLVGIGLLWAAAGQSVPSPWAVGGTFGVGQIAAAAILYVSLERRSSSEADQLRMNPSDEV